MIKPSWDQRIDRARELAAAYPFAADVLVFYSKLTAFQKGCYLYFQSTRGSATENRQGGLLRRELDSLDLAVVMPRFRPLLSMIEREGPAALGDFARALQERNSGAWAQLLTSFWQGDEPGRFQLARSDSAPPDPVPPGLDLPGLEPTPPRLSEFERFCAQALLQPYAEYGADQVDPPLPLARRPVCPLCAAKPLVGVLRAEGEGAKRSLICSFCRTEWDYLRIACPACEERREEKLCVYTSPQFEHLRIEACETCRTYLKTIDLTKNGLAVPEVDDLATIPLTLWANERGYKKLNRNTLGL